MTVEEQQELTLLARELAREVTELKASLQKSEENYAFLKACKEKEIALARSSAIGQIKKRVSHELAKLERCFRSRSTENFEENQEIGIKIIAKIEKAINIE